MTALMLPTLDEARRNRKLPSRSDEAAWDAELVTQIAHWADMVSPAAHDLAHPQPVQGCPWCPQSMVCPECLLPAPECKHPADHRRSYGESETSWREPSGVVS